MKKRVLKFLKGLAVFFTLLVLVVISAYFWPMPDLEPPIKHDTIIIRSINIVDVESGSILENRDVLIEHNIISQIDSVPDLGDYPNSLVINGSNQYLIPGLWDMHTHSTQHSPWLHHPIFIANGVTGVRDMSGQLNRRDSYWVGSKERLTWNAELNENKRVMPRYVLQSSYQIDGASSVPGGFPDFFKLQEPEDVDSLLGFYKNEKVDFIKIYQQIPPKIYEQLAIKAPGYGLHLAGHKPMFTSLEDAILLGQRSFEHGRIFMFESFPNADSLRTVKNWKSFYTESKKSMVEEFNPKIASSLMELMQRHNAHWVPTLQTLKFEAYAHNPSFLENQNLNYITTIRKKLWWDMDVKNNTKRNVSGDSKGVSVAFYKKSKEQIKMAKAIGVPIMTGTDVTDSYVFAGFSLHAELKELTNSGLSNLEALQSATIIPAKFAKMDMDYGSIEIGKTADLVILNENPLENIANSSTIYAVIINGTYYDSEKIEELKNFTKAIASSFHMNVKALFSLLGSPLIRVQFAD
ncbi:amidohydrolase family protein [Allomuricauda sp. d1]|uniref:amidohydrolase family protein n=1 Tax=Allomuricauda sp. d1 TaxID=3136725 RepID=UPI0031D37279